MPDTVTVTIRITPVPDTPPVALGDTYPCIDEDSVLQTLTYLEGVLGNDYDLDEKDSVLSAVVVTLPLHGSLILNPNGNKAPINLLKLGVSMVQIGEKDQGCKMINGVELQYPNANQSVIQKAKYESKKFECTKQES